MIEENQLETYLYVSRNKFQILTLNKFTQKKFYDDKLNLDDYFDFKDLSVLSRFLDKNIIKIEKLLNNFVKNIFLILDNNENLCVNISLKKKNYINSVNQRYLENILTELKNLYNESYPDQSIIHMIVENYISNGEKYTSFNKDLIIDNLCIEVNFISVSNDLMFAFDKLLEKYQIRISQYLCGKYVKKYVDDPGDELLSTAHKLKNGLNENEVMLVPKVNENKGFFEKFFQLFG